MLEAHSLQLADVTIPEYCFSHWVPDWVSWPCQWENAYWTQWLRRSDVSVCISIAAQPCQLSWIPFLCGRGKASSGDGKCGSRALSFLPAVQSQVLIVRSPRLGHAVSCPSSTIEDVCCTLYKHQIWLPRMLFHDKYVSTNEEHIYKTFHIALLKNGELTPQNSKLLPHNSNR